jgi:hypothetical protein
MAEEKAPEQKQEQEPAQEQDITHEELKKLPLRALVALCVRAAQRMRYHFDWLAKDAEHPERAKHPENVDIAMQVAYDFANGAELVSDARPKANAAFYATAFAPGNRDGLPARAAPMAVVVAISAAANEPEEAVRHASFLSLAYGPALAAIRADYNRLLEMNLGSFPELGKPVDARQEKL